MLDEFRKQADASAFEEESPAFAEEPLRPQGYFLGLRPEQRMIIAFMLLVITVLLSALCLLVTEKVMPPFLY